jgi:hypothetical protein
MNPPKIESENKNLPELAPPVKIKGKPGRKKKPTIPIRNIPGEVLITFD